MDKFESCKKILPYSMNQMFPSFIIFENEEDYKKYLNKIYGKEAIKMVKRQRLSDEERLEIAISSAEIIINGGTIRSASKKLEVPKSNIHYYIHHILHYEDPVIYNRTCRALKKNDTEKHKRGGEATKRRWLK